jgi:hypothetical protein
MTESGRLFVWGKVTNNENEKPIIKPTPSPFFFDVPVKFVAVGKGFSVILTGMLSNAALLNMHVNNNNFESCLVYTQFFFTIKNIFIG